MTPRVVPGRLSYIQARKEASKFTGKEASPESREIRKLLVSSVLVIHPGIELKNSVNSSHRYSS